MSVDTHAYIDGCIPIEDILAYIREKYDPQAEAPDITDRYGELFSEVADERIIFSDEEREHTIYGFINFDCGDEEPRKLFYSYTNNKFRVDAENECRWHPETLAMRENTYLSLGCWGSSVDIMTSILWRFGGGWLEENDCDGLDAYYIGC